MEGTNEIIGIEKSIGSASREKHSFHFADWNKDFDSRAHHRSGANRKEIHRHAVGSEEEVLQIFRQVRDEIKRVFEAYADGRRDQRQRNP